MYCETATKFQEAAPVSQEFLASPGRDRILARDHLRVTVRFGPVDLAHLLEIGRGYFAVISEGAVAPADHRLGDRDPGVVVAKDARVLLVTGRVGGDLAQLRAISV